MIQGLIVAIIFVGALSYLVRILFRQFSTKSACSTGCGKCYAIDFNKIESDLKAKRL